MKTNSCLNLFLATLIASVLAGCGGGGGGSDAGGAQYSLTPSQVPISAQDKLVTVTVQQVAAGAAVIEPINGPTPGILERALSGILAAGQVSPTLSAKATAKVVSGQVQLLNPVFSTTIKAPDPKDPKKLVDTVVSVTCDAASIPTTVNVTKAWALNLTTGDLLVNMDYPSSVTASYDPAAKKFSNCAFTYSNGFFVIYGDGSTSGPVDTALTQTSTDPACTGYVSPTGFRVIAAGDPSRNPSTIPLINDITSTTSVDFNTGTNYVGVNCGSLRSFDYVNKAIPVVTTIAFGRDVLSGNTTFLTDGTTVYALGADLGYGGGAIDAACPIVAAQIGGTTPACIGLQNQASYISYPYTAAQVQAAGTGNTTPVQKPNASMFFDASGGPTLSLQTYSGGCNFGSCLGTTSAPALFKIDVASTSATLLSTTALSVAYPWGALNPSPVGSSRDYVIFSNAGGGPSSGLLVNTNTGQAIHTCSNVFSGTDYGCSYSVNLGDYVYGMTVCAYQGAAPDVCINTPQIGRVNTLTGTLENWDLKSLGYLPLASMGNAAGTIGLPVPPIFYTDQVVFLACPSPNLTCANPNWVSLNYSTGQITPITTGGITFDMLQTLIGTTLWTQGI